jgi:hypothetical protein
LLFPALVCSQLDGADDPMVLGAAAVLAPVDVSLVLNVVPVFQSPPKTTAASL